MKDLQFSKLLAVEGKDEEEFFDAYLKHLGILGVHIENFEGKYKFGNYMDAQLNRTGFGKVEHFAIVRDADDNPKGAFDSICSSLRNNNINHPTKVNAFTKDKKSNINVGIYIMPGNLKEGALEDLCLKLPAYSDVLVMAKKYINNVAKCIYFGNWSKKRLLGFRLNRTKWFKELFG